MSYLYCPTNSDGTASLHYEMPSHFTRYSAFFYNNSACRRGILCQYSQIFVLPVEINLRETHSPYLVVPDADAVCAAAKAAGAAIVSDIADMSYEGRAFTCRDLEGHLWSIGTYDPWQSASQV
jgi:uncharacterized glyoxalase superfamily protein PhnB